MRYFITVLIILTCYAAVAQVTVCSWNIQNLGRSKTDKDIAFIAGVLKKYDAVAIIEVVAGDGGPQAVARLSEALNRTGARWDYSISDPTTSYAHGTERYAFLWKTSRLTRIGPAWLERKYSDIIDREPYLISLKTGARTFTLAAYHAVPTAKHPGEEIPYLQYIPAEYPNRNIIFCGDYNLSQANEAFLPLKALGYKPALVKQKTSLKRECNEKGCLASEYDNVFYHPQYTKYISSGVELFYTSFGTLAEAKKISDHIPVFFKFSLN